MFCRVRPLLPEDESFMQGEPPALFYPTSAELLGRGIELVQSQGPDRFICFFLFKFSYDDGDTIVSLTYLNS